MEWTSPSDVRAEVRRNWDCGRILSARLTEQPVFPLRVRMRRPPRRALSERFNEVRRWIRELEEGCRTRVGAGYDVVWVDIEHRQLGRNRIPRAIVVPTERDALHLIGERRAGERFDELATLTIASFPCLREWIIKRPLVLLQHADVWPRIVSVLAWLQAHPRPGLYLRQIEIPGVDTKFIEDRRALLTELLDRVLPAGSFDASAPSFEYRYGFRTKPPMVRFRLLDPRHTVGGLTDLSAPVAQLAAHAPPGARVFVTENEINGLVFPALEDSMVIFGLGYGLELLAQLPWLHDRELLYWGDIDTHGFVMLDRLRASFPHARSLLMDRETLMAHRPLWGQESRPHAGPCGRLTSAEAALFDDLVQHRLGDRVRLEQERLGYGSIARSLATLT